PGNLHAGIDGALMGVQTRKKWQEGRVDIEDLSLMATNESTGKQPHIAGKADDVGRNVVKDSQYGILVVLLRGEILPFEGMGCYATRPRPGNSAGRPPVRNDGNDFCRPVMRLARFRQGLHVGATTGNEDGNPFAAVVALCRRHRASVP